MKKGMIITCPEYDDATAYLSFYSQKIIHEAETRLIPTKIVKDKDFNLKGFSKIITKLDYNLVVFNAHGSSDAIYGYKHQMVISVGENQELLANRVVYARSCCAGFNLGQKCVGDDGCFIGYFVPFIFYMDSRWTTKPHNDKVAEIFLEPTNLVPLSLMRGRTASEAHGNSKVQMLKNLDRLMKGPQLSETPFYIEALWNNYAGQVLHGNGLAKI